METPSTPATRRATWRDDVLALVREFQEHASGSRVRESFPPWRIGYMAGLDEVRETDAAFVCRMSRVRPHEERPDVAIPKVGDPNTALMDRLCWHFDQDARGWGVEEMWDRDDPSRCLPRGPLLVDPLTAMILEEAGIDDATFQNSVAGSEHFGERREAEIGLRHPCAVRRMSVALRMNEASCFYKLPGTEATWRGGALTARLGNVPESVLIAARGRPVSDLVEHPLFEALPVLRVLSIAVGTKEGEHRVVTNGSTAAGMVGLAPVRQAARTA